PQGLGASAAELAHELADEVGHVIVIKEPDDDAAAPTVSLIQSNVSISMPLSEQDVLAKVKSVLGAAPIRQSRPAPQLLRFEGYRFTAVVATEAREALGQGVPAGDAKAKGTEAQGTQSQGTEALQTAVVSTADAGRTVSTRIALAVAFAVFLVTAALGWIAWG